VNLIVGTLQTNILAFPSALGFGANAHGARLGGTVYHVTTLAGQRHGFVSRCGEPQRRFVGVRCRWNDHAEQRCCLFERLTIAGQTAPGDGIAIMATKFPSARSRMKLSATSAFAPAVLSSSGEDAINVGDAPT